MAKKLTDLTDTLATPAADDLLHIVDVSDTTQDPAGSSKKIEGSVLVQSLLSSVEEISTTPETIPDGTSRVTMLPGSDVLNLPLANSTFDNGVLVLNRSGSTKSITTTGAQLIDGANSFVIPTVGWAQFFPNDTVDGWFGIGGIATTQDSVDFGDRVFIGVGS